MNNYQVILEDLLRTLPIEVVPYPPPYTDALSLDDKFIVLRDATIRSGRMGNRILQLANAFYLGRFLEKDITNLQRKLYAPQLSFHYRNIAIRTYYIFEPHGVEQVMRTIGTTMTTIRELTKDEYSDLIRRSARIFNGVENIWEGVMLH
jgi:hypothetical protein